MKVFCSRYKEFETLLNHWKNKEDLSHIEISDNPDVVTNQQNKQVTQPTSEDTLNEKNSFGTQEHLIASDSNVSSLQTNKKVNLVDPKVPQIIIKRGRSKGGEVTVVGTYKKKARNGVIPFSKLTAPEKDRILLESFISRYIANEVVYGENW